MREGTDIEFLCRTKLCHVGQWHIDVEVALLYRIGQYVLLGLLAFQL